MAFTSVELAIEAKAIGMRVLWLQQQMRSLSSSEREEFLQELRRIIKQ